LKTDLFTLKPSLESFPNSFVVLNSGDIAHIQFIHLVNERYVIGFNGCSKELYFQKPLPSNELGIFKIDLNDTTLKYVYLQDVAGKLVVFPYKKKYIAIPLLHTC